MAMAMAASQLPSDLQECLTWLQNCFRYEEVEIFESLRCIFAPGNASLTDVVNVLRDGIVLCQLLVILSNGVIRRGDLHGFRLITLNSVCVYRDNITAFLTVCQSYFELTEEKLFLPDDLIDRKNIDRVISCLAALSQSPRVDQKRFPGFQVSERLRVALRHLSTRQPAWSELSESVERLRCNIIDIYSDQLTASTDNEAVYGSVVDDYEYELDDDEDSRKGNWQQLLQSEQNYTHLLEQLVAYSRSLNGPNGTAAEPAFRYIPALFELHSRLLRRLEATARVSRISERLQAVCDCIADEKMNLCVAYRDYLVNMPHTVECADKLQEGRLSSPEASSLLPHHPLRDLLLAPLQRVQRYPDIFKACSETRSAMEDFMDICGYAQSYKENESVCQVLDRIQAGIAGLDNDLQLRNFGSLLIEGEVRISHMSYERSEKDSRSVYCYLTGELLIVCRGDKKTNGRLEFLFSIALPERCDIGVEEAPRYKSWRWLLTISQPENATPNSTTDDDLRYRLHLKSFRVQQAWLAAFKRALSVRYPPHHNSFRSEFRPAICREPTNCRECRRLIFVGYGHGYRCKVSGRVVHQKCIPSAPRQRRITQDTSQEASKPPLPQKPQKHQKPQLATSPPQRSLPQPPPPPPHPPTPPPPTPPPPPGLKLAHAKLLPPPPPRKPLIPRKTSDEQPRCVPRRSSISSGSAAQMEDISLMSSSDESSSEPDVPETPGANFDCYGAASISAGWHGRMSRGAAWARLLRAPVGTYLVRCSPRPGVEEHILSYRITDGVRHKKIFEADGHFYLEEKASKFVSIQELLQFYATAQGLNDGCLEVQLRSPA